jgi:tyrosyl-tRNA synthetase
VERGLPDEIEELPITGDPVHLPALIAEAFDVSTSEGRRLIAQGGVRIDGQPLADGRLDVPAGELDGAVLQVGKRRFKRLRRAP